MAPATGKQSRLGGAMKQDENQKVVLIVLALAAVVLLAISSGVIHSRVLGFFLLAIVIGGLCFMASRKRR
jgi:hypothetical protein